MMEQLEKKQLEQREKIQDEALEVIMGHKRSGLGISMGVGKTRIAMRHFINHYSPDTKCLVVVPKNTIMDSWYTEWKKWIR